MPAQGQTVIDGTVVAAASKVYLGNRNILQGQPGVGYSQGQDFSGVTGGPNSTLAIAPSRADIPSTPGTYSLVGTAHTGPLPSVSPFRPYLRGLKLKVLGTTAWTGGNWVQIQDTNGNTGLYIPVSALQGNAEFVFGGQSEQRFGLINTCTGTYNATTGAVTFPATMFFSTGFVNNCPFQIIAGTGQGQAGVVASNTSTVMTPNNGAATFPIPPDNTSVFEFAYWVATGTIATAITTAAQAGSTTPFVAGQLAQDTWLLDLTTPAVGNTSAQIRLITSNTNNTATVPTMTTTAVNGDLIEFTSAPALQGCIDYATKGLPVFGPGTGLQVVVGAGMSAGSPLRLSYEGDWGR